MLLLHSNIVNISKYSAIFLECFRAEILGIFYKYLTLALGYHS